MTFMRNKIYYFANSVPIVFTFLGLTQRSYKIKNSFDKKVFKKASQLKQQIITTLLKCKEIRMILFWIFLKCALCLTFFNTKLT